MDTPSPPHVPQFRVTLFYGPDPSDGTPPSQHCTFNVKKRSWKSGIQVTISITNEQLTRLQHVTGFDRWLASAIRLLPEEDSNQLESRARDIFIQIVSSCKLDLAIKQGLSRETEWIGGEKIVEELDRFVAEHIARLHSQFRTELDLPV